MQTIFPFRDGTANSRFSPIHSLTTITKSTADQSALGKLNNSYLCKRVTIILLLRHLDAKARVWSANSTKIISPIDELENEAMEAKDFLDKDIYDMVLKCYRSYFARYKIDNLNK